MVTIRSKHEITVFVGQRWLNNSKFISFNLIEPSGIN